MKAVSEEFKALTRKIKQQDVKLIVDNKNFDYKKLVYSFNGRLFKTIMKQIEITLKNANEIKDKNVNFQYGLNINNQFEYIDLGDYYIKDIEDSKKKDEITVTGYDKMLFFMKTFKQSELKITYPCTILQLVQKICEICKVDLYSTNFLNANLVVEDDFFTTQKLTCRDVLEKITQATLTTAFIKEDKLYFCKIENNLIQKIDKSYLTDLIVKENFGPVNALVLGRGDVEDNIEEVNAHSIAENGRCEIRFDENELVQYKREQIILDMFNEIKGLEYYSFKGSDVGIMWLEPCDCIELGDREDNFYKSYYLKANITINTGISSNIEADIIEETNTEYKVTTKEEKKHLKVERLAKKNEGLIQDLIQETSEHEKKITEVIQTMDSITQKVENIADLTREVSGTIRIQLDNCMQGELLELHIYGNNTVFERVFPSNNLYPSKTLYPRSYGKIAINKINLKSDIQPVIANLDIVNHQYNTGLQFCRSLIIPISEKGKKYTIFKKAGARFAVGTFDEEPAQGIIATNYISDENEGNGLTKLELTSTDNDKFLVVFFYDAYNDSESLATLYNSIEIYADYQEIELTQIKRGLRQFEDVCDELVLINNKLQVIRRIGVDNENNKYILENEKIEDLGELQIELSEGTNYIEILNYVANMQAKYVVRNEFTSKFATTVELKSAITQLADSINLTLSKKINEEDIIAALNLAILKESDAEIPEEIEKSIIQMIANILEIDADNFKLSRDGTMIALAGKIAGWLITKYGLFSPEIQDELHGDHSPSGLVSGNVLISEDLNGITFFAGRYLGKDGKPAFYVTPTGKVYGKSFDIFDNDQKDKAYIKMYNPNSQVGSYMTSDTMSAYNMIAGDGGVQGHCMHGRDGQNGHIYTVTWTQDAVNEPYYLAFWVDNSFVAFLENDTSDKRLKKDIEDIDEKLLLAIEEIQLKQFKLIDEETKKAGVIAQNVIYIFKKYGLNYKDYGVVYKRKKFANDRKLYYFVNYEQLLLLKIKCLENISKKQKKELRTLDDSVKMVKNENTLLKKQIGFLINKLNCEKEIEEYMKGDN